MKRSHRLERYQAGFAGTALAVLFGLLSACGAGYDRPATRAELRQALESAESIEVQYVAGPAAGGLVEALVAGGGSLEQRLARPVILREGVDSSSTRSPRIVIGCPTDPGVQELFLALGGSLEGDEVRIAGLELGRDASLLHVCAEDPRRPGLPLQLLTSRVRVALVEGVEDLMPTAAPGVSLRAGRDPLMKLGSRELRASAPRRREPVALPEGLVGGGGLLLRYGAEIAPERAEKYKSRAVRTLARVAEWTGATPEEKLELQAFGHGAGLREFLGESDLAAGDGHHGRHALLLGPGLPDDHGALAARWSARQTLGAPDANWLLDGIALDAADRWWGRPLEEWGRYLAAGDLLPSVREVVSDRSVDELSQHVLAPARGLLLRHLRSTRGDDVLRTLWSDAASVGHDDSLQQSFSAWLAPTTGAGPRHPARGLVAGSFRRGVALYSDARPGGGGLDSRGLFASLKDAKGHDANALSITSFFSEVPGPAGAFGGRLPLGRNSIEGDVALAEAVAQARRAGVTTVMLQPHLLLSDSAGYSAWLRRTNRTHWEEFFDALDPMLVHYGLLAELCGVDLLCVGTSLSTPSANSGLLEEVKALHDERWRRAIGLARRSFGGLLTYGATWPGEAASVRFWSELDLVGVSLFPRFATLAEAPQRDAALRSRWNSYLEGLEELCASVGKPALIVELGARSTELAATEVGVATGDLDLAEQERTLATFVEALAGRPDSRGSLTGVFLWKWTPEQRGGGAGDRGFALQNKPAARLLSRLGQGAGSSGQGGTSEDDGD